MQIVFSDHSSVELLLHSTPLVDFYQKAYKHLQHVLLPFREWDNPWYIGQVSYQDLVSKLSLHAKQLGIDIDPARCLTQEQAYFNYLHEIYHQHYNGNPVWLDYHEHIHLCEKYHEPKPKILHIDYREKAGMLERKFDSDWLKLATTNINAGDVFLEWAELGKNPYYFWLDNEPDNAEHICELIKPWLKLKPVLRIAMEPVDKLKTIQTSEFEIWWQQHNQTWCEHYGLASYSVSDIFGGIVIGTVPQYQLLINNLKNNHIPIKVTL